MKKIENIKIIIYFKFKTFSFVFIDNNYNNNINLLKSAVTLAKSKFSNEDKELKCINLDITNYVFTVLNNCI